MRPASALAVALVLSLCVLGGVASGTASYALGQASTATTACVPTADPFAVTGATWGTPSSPLSAGPGSADVPLSVTFLYTGGCPLTAARFEAGFSAPLASTAGTNSSTTFEVSIASDAVLTETYHVSIAPDAQLGTYTVGLDLGYNTTEFAGLFFETTNATISLKGVPKLELSASSTGLVPGEVNNLTLTLANQGTGPASSVSVSASPPSQVSILSQLPSAQALQPGSSVSQPFLVYVPSSMAGSALSLPLTASYLDPYSLSGVSTVVLGFSVSPLQQQQLSASLAQLNDTLQVGSLSRVAFELTNTGGGTIYSPTLSISAASPVVVLGSSVSSPAGPLAPSQSALFAAEVGASPSSAPGIYGGTATVSYLDGSGASHVQTFQVGFVLAGSVEFVLQDVVVSQTSTDVTVSGSLLNEGTTNAFYAVASGFVGSGPSQNQSSYVGEVDQNTPTPFTITIPYPAPATAQRGVAIGIRVVYKDSFGKTAAYSTTVTADLESATQLLLGTSASGSSSQQSGSGLLTIVSYGVVAVVVVAIVGSAVIVRRRRSSSKPGREDRVI